VSHFPETRHTLIRRLATSRSETDWGEFLADYWRPVCRFAARWGKVNLDDAEDIASVTLQALLTGDLLKRWVTAPQSRLRTLLCRIVRNVISNRARVQSGRDRIHADHRVDLARLGTVGLDEDSPESGALEDAFYAAWAEELLQSCLQSVQSEYQQSGRGDYFRVLYGKVCEDLQNAEIASALQLKVTDVENYYKRARTLVADRLRSVLAAQVERYCPAENDSGELQQEWNRLGEYLRTCGGLEQAIRNSYDLADGLTARESTSKTAILRSLQERSVTF
jgi:RNA polymerase sigma factor (sigma-70 family)